MIEFFINVMIVTGGLLCLIFWFLGLIELVDHFLDVKARRKTENEAIEI